MFKANVDAIVSLLLTLNIFHTSFYRFYCCLWTDKCLEAKMFIVKKQTYGFYFQGNNFFGSYML